MWTSSVLSMSGHVAYMRLIKEHYKYLSEKLKLCNTWEN
jgi:hypothetical protein